MKHKNNTYKRLYIILGITIVAVGVFLLIFTEPFFGKTGIIGLNQSISISPDDKRIVFSYTKDQITSI